MGSQSRPKFLGLGAVQDDLRIKLKRLIERKDTYIRAPGGDSTSLVLGNIAVLFYSRLSSERLNSDIIGIARNYLRYKTENKQPGSGSKTIVAIGLSKLHDRREDRTGPGRIGTTSGAGIVAKSLSQAPKKDVLNGIATWYKWCSAKVY